MYKDSKQSNLTLIFVLLTLAIIYFFIYCNDTLKSDKLSKNLYKKGIKCMSVIVSKSDYKKVYFYTYIYYFKNEMYSGNYAYSDDTSFNVSDSIEIYLLENDPAKSLPAYIVDDYMSK